MTERLRILRREIRLAMRDSVIAFRLCRKPLRAAISRLLCDTPFRVTLRNGLRIAGPYGRSLLPLIDDVFRRSEYEQFGIEVKRGDFVVDVGAHVGVFTLLAATRGAARVIAYEPFAENVAYLHENLTANRVTSAVVHHAAVGGETADVRLIAGRESVGGRVLETTREQPSLSHREVSAVRCETLAGVIERNGLRRIDLLKLDCEGSEGAILSAARDEDLAIIRAVVLEYHEPWSLESAEAIAGVLLRHGFIVNVVPGADSDFGMIYAQRTHSAYPQPPQTSVHSRSSAR